MFGEEGARAFHMKKNRELFSHSQVTFKIAINPKHSDRLNY